jgi:hypothetical protein
MYIPFVSTASEGLQSLIAMLLNASQSLKMNTFMDTLIRYEKEMVIPWKYLTQILTGCSI